MKSKYDYKQGRSLAAIVEEDGYAEEYENYAGYEEEDYDEEEDNSDDSTYKNSKENRFTNQSDLYGKIFLIKDALKQPEWQLEKETKNIGNYTCFKATFKQMVRVSNSMTVITNNDKKSNAPEIKINLVGFFFFFSNCMCGKNTTKLAVCRSFGSNKWATCVHGGAEHFVSLN